MIIPQATIQNAIITATKTEHRQGRGRTLQMAAHCSPMENIRVMFQALKLTAICEPITSSTTTAELETQAALTMSMAKNCLKYSTRHIRLTSLSTQLLMGRNPRCMSPTKSNHDAKPQVVKQVTETNISHVHFTHIPISHIIHHSVYIHRFRTPDTLTCLQTCQRSALLKYRFDTLDTLDTVKSKTLSYIENVLMKSW